MEGLVLAQAAREGVTPALPALAARTTPQALAAIWRSQGWRPLFAGLSIKYLKVGILQGVQLLRS